MRRLTVLTAVFLLPLSASAQEVGASDSGREGVMQSVHALFSAMRAGDSTAVRAVFHPSAQLRSVVGPDSSGAFAVREGAVSVDDFARAVGRPHDAVWDERIGEVDVQIDGGLATAWMPYAFYLGEEFSHCGVNAFHLVQTSEGWKVLHITDTRRTTDCEAL